MQGKNITLCFDVPLSVLLRSETYLGGRGRKERKCYKGYIAKKNKTMEPLFPLEREADLRRRSCILRERVGACRCAPTQGDGEHLHLAAVGTKVDGRRVDSSCSNAVLSTFRSHK